MLALRFRWARDRAVARAVRRCRCTASRKVEQSFFPPATRPQFMVDVFLPAGTHIRETEAFADDVEKYIQEQPGVTHVTSFIGGGGLRFLLVYTPEKENRAFVQFLVDVDDAHKIDGLIAEHPEAPGREASQRQRGRQEVSARARSGRPHPGAVPAGPIRPCCANWATRRKRYSKTTAARSAFAATGGSAKR